MLSYHKIIKYRKLCLLMVLFVFVCSVSFADLSLQYIKTIQHISIYKDLSDTKHYFYSPGTIELAEDNKGKPDLKFLQMRYSGSAATGNKGAMLYKSLLQFKVGFRKVDSQKLNEIKADLKLDDSFLFSPLPLHSIKANLVYAAINAPKAMKKADGFFETSSDEADDVGSWTEKTFTVSLDNESSQLFWDALSKGKTIISLNYEYYSMCKLLGDETRMEITEHFESQNQLKEKSAFELNDIKKESSVDSALQQIKPSTQVEEMRKGLVELDSVSKSKLQQASSQLVYSDATGINFDSDLYSSLLLKVDINESRIPPGFAVMEVRCYDFNTSDTPDLYAKRIELEATGMDNQPVKQQSTFYSYQTDSYCHAIKFPFAIKMNMPYRYRVVEIKEDGAKKYSDWKIAKNWVSIIDITQRN